MTKNEQLLMTACELAVQHLDTQMKEAAGIKGVIQETMDMIENPGPFWTCLKPMGVCGKVFRGKLDGKYPYCGGGVRLITHKEYSELFATLIIKAVNRDHLFDEMVEALKAVHGGHGMTNEELNDLIARVEGKEVKP